MCLLATGSTYPWEHHIGARLGGGQPPGALGDTSGKGGAVGMELPTLGAALLRGHPMSCSSGVGSGKRWIGGCWLCRWCCLAVTSCTHLYPLLSGSSIVSVPSLFSSEALLGKCVTLGVHCSRLRPC